MAYIPNTDDDRAQMLDVIGLATLDELFDSVPEPLRLAKPLNIPSRMDQMTLARHARNLGSSNADAQNYACFLGAGIYDHYVPPTVAAITGRSEFYTSYTPYQPEVSQGVLQSIYEFQTLIAQLYGMDLANASMYDTATGLAEAAIMAADITGRKRILAFDTLHPVHREVLDTYVRHLGLSVETVPASGGVGDLSWLKRRLNELSAAVLVQHPNFFGNLEDMGAISEATHAAGALLVASADPNSLGLLCAPGDYGADIAVGEGQGLGNTMGYGGPLLGLFACKKQFIRRLPGRIVGATTDLEGRRAFVMTLRTREQDIRREKATSNICTNVALYALAATVYLATMGKHGMRQVAELCLQKAHYASSSIARLQGYSLAYPKASFFKEFVINCPIDPDSINRKLWKAGIVGGYRLNESQMLVAVTEQRTRAEIDELVRVLGEAAGRTAQ